MPFSDPAHVNKNRIKLVDTSIDKEKITLEDVCNDVISLRVPYEDVAEVIELKAYQECEANRIDSIVQQLSRLALFFESLENKNEENSRDLADVYLLIGQIFQFSGKYEESIVWFTRSTIVDDQYPVPFHNLALSYIKLKKVHLAIRSLEQEIVLAPGNYYSYLLLSDIYKQERKWKEFEDCLKRLLERDPDNMQGLHRLIQYYLKKDPLSDVTLLCRRILNINKTFNRPEAMIRIYHLCNEKRFTEALDFVESWTRIAPETTIVHLLKAYIYNLQKKYKLKKNEIEKFIERNKGKDEIGRGKLDEFGQIFGAKTLKKIINSVAF